MDEKEAYSKRMVPIVHKNCDKLKNLLAEKAAGYGPSWQTAADMMLVLFPDGIPPYAYTDALLIVRVLDKLQRLAHAIINERGDGGNEDPWYDLAGYGMVGCSKDDYIKSFEQLDPEFAEKLTKALNDVEMKKEREPIDLERGIPHAA